MNPRISRIPRAVNNLWSGIKLLEGEILYVLQFSPSDLLIMKTAERKGTDIESSVAAVR